MASIWYGVLPRALACILLCAAASAGFAQELPIQAVSHEVVLDSVRGLTVQGGRVAVDGLRKFEKPWFYHDLEGPTYKVLSKPGGEFEERRYDKSVWVSTNVESISYSLGTSKGFKSLFNYISGANHKNETIPMTLPVKVAVKAGEGPFCSNTFKVSFYVPGYKQDNVPKPTSKDLFVEDNPKQTFYVSSYGGFALDGVVVYKAKAAIAGLEAMNITVGKPEFLTAGYDPPFRLLGRHNEIWLPAQSSDILAEA